MVRFICGVPDILGAIPVLSPHIFESGAQTRHVGGDVVRCIGISIRQDGSPLSLRADAKQKRFRIFPLVVQQALSDCLEAVVLFLHLVRRRLRVHGNQSVEIDSICFVASPCRYPVEVSDDARVERQLLLLLFFA
ncbi:hypothetical protein SAZ_20790 [Streptomyces noursei ZPM]|nr:hypothetical protein SAZ_20790 [Streptomyces noursei ZPM]EXU88706.1 hypothetical protein P354_27615 [Streptomyces noursei PD-1]